jgi:hypothetical protein
MKARDVVWVVLPLVVVCFVALTSHTEASSLIVAQAEVKKPDAAHEGVDPKELFEKKCTQCHDTKRIQDAHLDKERGKKIVEKMRKKSAANITEEEGTTIYDYMQDVYMTPAPALPY